MNQTNLSIAFDRTHANSDLYRLKKGDIVQLKPGYSLVGHKVAVFGNYPLNDREFERSHYQVLQWENKKTPEENQYKLIDNIDCFCAVKVEIAGTFHFYFSFEENGKQNTNQEGSVYVQVEPEVMVGPEHSPKIIPIDAIRCQTVLSKLLGPLDTWESKLRVGKESGYNMIHFTPIQTLGLSRSCYSLSDQHKVNTNFSNDVKKAATFEDVDKVITKIREEWNIATICDIVLNHTANESEWLKEHPECTYSSHTCPHLRPAFLLDALLSRVSNNVAAGLLEHVGVPKVVENEDHLNALRHQMFTVFLPKINLQEFYQCNIEEYVMKFSSEIRSRAPPSKNGDSPQTVLALIQDPEFRRLKTKIDFDLALDLYNIFRVDCFDEDTRLRKCTEEFRAKLEELNGRATSEIQNYMNSAIENCLAGIRYERIHNDGPLLKEISKEHPLFQTYFTKYGIENLQLKQIEKMMYEPAGRFYMAHNGWVINGDPLNDFAKYNPGIANVYLKRELIAWGDSVKLRYGDKPEDCPYLWEHMKKYVNMTAKIFNGVRLDNCHSTPLHVAEYLIDAARKINPELYVVAELFTNSDQTDNIFVNKLGISSLIREAQSAWDSHEEGRLVYRYGGMPVGAFTASSKQPLIPQIAHAMFLDLTHDNPSPVEKRSVFDLLPTAALVSMACCSTGSNRGYDELVPHHIHVVNEERQYQEWRKHVTANTGIIAAKNAFNLLHGELAEKGFNQVYVDQMNTDIVAVSRHSPITHETVILVAHTCFDYPDSHTSSVTYVPPLTFEGDLKEIILEATIQHSTGKPFDRPFGFKKDEHYVNGISGYSVEVCEHIKLSESRIFGKTMIMDQQHTKLQFENLNPGSVVAVRVTLSEFVQSRMNILKDLETQLSTKQGQKKIELKSIISKLDLLQLNRALYTCDAEERDLGFDSSAYDIPGFGPLVYCGFQGIVSLLDDITPTNDLGHPLCNNLRQGNWLIEYIYSRLKKINGTQELGMWLEQNLAPLKDIPRYLIPNYFNVLIKAIHKELVVHAINLMSAFVRNSGTLVQLIALGSIQMIANCNSSVYPKPTQAAILQESYQHVGTLAAGLPHFATGYMRCWGRDTFISLRGLMLLCGRVEEARYVILAFASTLRHGLIPNLLDSGTNPRYNCRDAIWWWLSSIKDYVDEVPNGKEILHEKVFRYFNNNLPELKKPGENVQFLYEIIKEALNVHFQGLCFREHNAGTKIDAHMRDKGFNIQIGIDPETGFVFGGNDANCGTWMDKMGSSDNAGNRGLPSTSRDGSSIELVGIMYSVLRFLDKMSDERQIPFGSVERISQKGLQTIWTFKEWSERVKSNFEKHFYVDKCTVGKYINKRGIYKDSFNASQPWTDFQLRCNFPIAMVAAPELFDPEHGWTALEMAKKYLLGPLGMRTLDPEDWSYRGDYDNSNDCDDPKIAHGANYHQGPEWLWPIGYFLRARLIFAEKNNKLQETVEETWKILAVHFKEVQKNHWNGLPELTNSNGKFCRDSCATQAWSMATVLEVLNDLNGMQNTKQKQ